MRKRGGFIGSLMGILSTLIIIGLVLAIFTQFNGNFGDMIRWILDAAWSIITSVRDTVMNWDTFQRIF